MIELRSSRVAFRVTGPEAHKLLNDVLTCSIPESSGEAKWWALLSPQGKIQAEGLISVFEGAYYLDVSRDIVDRFFKRMGMYKLRAKADIADLRESHSVGWSAEQVSIGDGIQDCDNRAGGLGYRLIVEQSNAQNWAPRAQEYTSARINVGISELGADFEADTLFPHDIGMDILGAVDFSKGCYVGQEVVSRMKHRGNARRRPIIVRLDTGQKGDEIMVGGKKVGTLGETCDGMAIGNARIDRIFENSEASVNGQAVKLAVPPWASYAFASDSISQSDS